MSNFCKFGINFELGILTCDRKYLDKTKHKMFCLVVILWSVKTTKTIKNVNFFQNKRREKRKKTEKLSFLTRKWRCKRRKQRERRKMPITTISNSNIVVFSSLASTRVLNLGVDSGFAKQVWAMNGDIASECFHDAVKLTWSCILNYDRSDYLNANFEKRDEDICAIGRLHCNFGLVFISNIQILLSIQLFDYVQFSTFSFNPKMVWNIFPKFNNVATVCNPIHKLSITIIIVFC